MLKEARNYYIEEQTKHPEWVYSEEGKMLKTLQSWAEFDIKMAQDILAEKSTQPKSSGVKVEGEIYDTKNPKRNKYAHFSVPQGTDIGGSHLVGYPSADRNHDENIKRFKLYTRLVKDGIISPGDVPSSVFKNLANEGRSQTDEKTGKVTKNPDADFFYRLLVEQVKNGNVISDKEYLNSIPKQTPRVEKIFALPNDITLNRSSVAYRFADKGLDSLSNSEVRDLGKQMYFYSKHHVELGDKVVSADQALDFALIKIGLERHGLKTKVSDSERNKLIGYMELMYDDIRNPSKDIAFRKNEEKHKRINGSTFGALGYGACKALDGSESSCDKALVVGSLIGDVLGARSDAKSNRITSPAQLNPLMSVKPSVGNNRGMFAANNHNEYLNTLIAAKARDLPNLRVEIGKGVYKNTYVDSLGKQFTQVTYNPNVWTSKQIQDMARAAIAQVNNKVNVGESTAKGVNRNIDGVPFVVKRVDGKLQAYLGEK